MTGRKFQLVIFCVDVAIRCKKMWLTHLFVRKSVE